MAAALQVKKAAHTIHAIKDPSGNILATSEDIADQFVQYFSKLDNLPTSQSTANPNDRTAAIQDFLQQYSTTPLTIEELTGLDLPLSVEEILTALKQLKTGKSPGPDSMTVSYYKSFPDTLIPQLIKAFNNLSPSNVANKDILEAQITLIPKQSKDTRMVSNYRPISLLNVDVKLYAKALENHILPLLLRLIALDQVGFVPGSKALNIHHFLSTTSTQGFLSHLTEWPGTIWR